MPVGLNALELNSFFKLPSLLTGKSIQPAFKFYATFLDNPLSTKRSIGPGPMPIIRAYHILNVSIPTYNFKKETMFYGQVPRSFPILEMDGALQVTVTFEEDELGTIAYFVNWLQRSIITEEGYYRAPRLSLIGHLVVEVQDKNGIPVVYHSFNDIFYLATSDVTYDYASNETIKYDITFGVNRMSTWFTKYSAIAAVQKGAQSVLRSVLPTTMTM
jgi:hypothetical protein